MDEQQIEEFVFQVVGDIGAAMSGPLVLMGDRLGLWTAIADSESVTSASLASSTDINERWSGLQLWQRQGTSTSTAATASA